MSVISLVTIQLPLNGGLRQSRTFGDLSNRATLLFQALYDVEILAGLDRTRRPSGKIVVLPGLSDAQLRQAYRSSLFTVFPSLCEGWGLPIAESLAVGLAVQVEEPA